MLPAVLSFLTLSFWLAQSELNDLPPPNIRQNWGQYSPYFDVVPYLPPPPDCSITQVNILERHGARFPTTGASIRLIGTVNKLKSATAFTDPDLEFISSFNYTLGANDLIPFGTRQATQSGESAFERYKFLLSKTNVPFIRASGSQRVIDSATNWTAGFISASRDRITLPPPLILSEAGNDTLDDNMCPNAGSSDAADSQWEATFAPPIAARLNKGIEGVVLNNSDITSLLQLCAFESLAQENASPFCKLFKPEEFLLFEYSGDVDKYYNTGYGQPLGPVQGVGYVNELIARLTGQPVSDATQTNRTLDSSPATFPLNMTIYADFSHDNQMIAIYAAMGMFKQLVPLSLSRPNPKRTWLASHLVPFSARMVTERLNCHGSDFVRISVSNQFQPLEFCGSGNGLCRLDKFVASQRYSRENGQGDFEECFTA